MLNFILSEAILVNIFLPTRERKLDPPYLNVSCDLAVCHPKFSLLDLTEMVVSSNCRGTRSPGHLENPYINQVLKSKEILTSAEHFTSASFLNINPIESILVEILTHLCAWAFTS